MADRDQITRLNGALERRYRIERELGEGGMATVYLARDERHNRHVALKVLKPELAAVVGAERFLAEIETTAALQHPHILPLFDSGEADGFLFYVMPYVEGESLRQRLDREHQLPVDDAVRIATNMAEALDYAHRQGVVHRDIKPANVLLLEGKPVISDFGIALAIGTAGEGRLTETGLSLGTPHYMSPEQATGDTHVGPPTDIYALGCVLYEMLVGEPPHTGSTPQAVLGKIITEPPAGVRKERKTVPPNVEAAVAKALEKVPADRFVNAGTMADALGDGAFRHGGQPLADAPRPRGTQWSPVAKTAGVAAAVLAGALGWSLTRPTAEPPVARFELTLPNDVSVGGYRGLAMSEDGETLVFADDVTGQLFVRRIGDVAPRAIPDTRQAFYPFISPDGEWVAYFELRADALMKVRLDGSGMQRLATVPPTNRSGVWLSDGTIVGHSGSLNGLWRVPETGGEPQPIPGTEDLRLSWMHLVPGHEVVVGGRTTTEGRQISAVSLETGERRDLVSGMMPKVTGSGHLLFWREDGLYAVAFDPRRLEVRNEPTRVVDRVGGRTENGFAWYAVGGDHLFYQGGGADEGRSLVLVDRDGRVEPLPFEPRTYQYPRVAPDGRRVVASILSERTGGDADLWMFDLDRGTRSRLTFEGNNRYYPVWHPDGRQVTITNRTGEGNAVYQVMADGSGRADTLRADAQRQYPTSWSRDGRFLAMHQQNAASGDRDIWVWPVDGEPELFTATPFEDHAPAFSPDGRWIAYVSDKSGRHEIYVRPYPGPGLETIVSTDGGTEPVWSPRGDELFYRSEEAVMAVAVEAGDTFRAEPPVALFLDQYWRDTAGAAGTPAYDVMPDGERFLMATPGTGAVSAPGVLVLNFAQELERLVPGS